MPETSRQKIIKPGNLHEIIILLKSANESKTPVFPVSAGKNWGYDLGGAKKGIILDLSKLNRIIDYNEELAYVTVEPGVTFEQLFRFLKKKKSNLMMTTSGASPEASLIGGTVERGIGRGFYPKRNEYICGLEIVLPTGKIINTGFKSFGSKILNNVFKEAIGPDTSGLFLQSNLGIITKMTIWLTPMPKFIQTFHCFIRDENHLSELIDNFRKLKFTNIIKSSVFFANDYKILANKQQYPWKEMKNKTPLDEKILNQLKLKLGVKGFFSAEGMVASSDKEESVYKTNKIKEILKNLVADLKFSEPFPTKMIYLFNYSNTLPGVPSEEALPSLYWRKKKTIPKKIDPWRDRCGLIWIGLVSPLLGKTMIKVGTKVKEIFAKYGFEPNIAFNLATERAAYINVMIIYDKEVQGEDQRALKCYKTTISAVKKYGIIPYRLTTKGMASVDPDVNYSSFIKSLKKLVDPNNILSPGRYDFS